MLFRSPNGINLNLLPYPVPFKFIPFGDGKTNPLNLDLLHMITTGVSIKAFVYTLSSFCESCCFDLF